MSFLRSVLRTLLLPLALVAFFDKAACGQADVNTTDPKAILTNADAAGSFNSCVPELVDDGNSYTSACCGSPGQRGCSTGFLTATILPVCLKVSPTLKYDGYFSTDAHHLEVLPLCLLGASLVDPKVAALFSSTASDHYFYSTSDSHFFRDTFHLDDQLTHVHALNTADGVGLVWPKGAGALTGTPLVTPEAVMINGDITTHGAASDLGAFRLNYEEGTIPDSLRFPMLFGLGNHEIKTESDPNEAHRMFDYLTSRMANTTQDSGSGNYSWDWGGVHMVQLNTWAADKTSMYVHDSDGLSWLQKNLKQFVGNSTKPVIIFQHYGLKNVGTVADTWWPTNATAVDASGNQTGQGYEAFFDIVKNYNVIGMFSGHTHCLAVNASDQYSSDGTNSDSVYLGGNTSYGQPIDNFDDGSGGDVGTRGSTAGKCHPDTIGSFLTAHVNQHYLDVGAISWGRQQSQPHFDTNIGFTNTFAACRKRINSQFIPVISDRAMLTYSTNTYTVSTKDKPLTDAIDVPLAVQFNVLGSDGYDFVDSCAGSAQHAYALFNGESGVAADTVTTKTLSATITGTPILYALTPMSGVSPSSFAQTAPYSPKGEVTPPIPSDSLRVYGPAKSNFTATVNYLNGTDWIVLQYWNGSEWTALTPGSIAAFDDLGRAKFQIVYDTTNVVVTKVTSLLAQIVIQAFDNNNIPTLRQTVDDEIDFKAPVTVTLTPNQPETCDPIASDCYFTAAFLYTPLIDPTDGKTPIQITGVAALVNGGTTQLSSALVSNQDDQQFCDTWPEGTVVFGAPGGTGFYCQSLAPGSAPGLVGGPAPGSPPGLVGAGLFSTANLSAGLYTLTAAYQGAEGLNKLAAGDSAYAPAVSAPLTYRIGDNIAGIAALGGSGQSVPLNAYFDQPLWAIAYVTPRYILWGLKTRRLHLRSGQARRAHLLRLLVVQLLPRSPRTRAAMHMRP